MDKERICKSLYVQPCSVKVTMCKGRVGNLAERWNRWNVGECKRCGDESMHGSFWRVSALLAMIGPQTTIRPKHR
jgi:hypothetical protein